MRNTYLGVCRPRDAFDALRPLRERLLAMQGTVRPFGPDYLVLEAAKTALETAAFHFTREPHFFGQPAQDLAPSDADEPG